MPNTRLLIILLLVPLAAGLSACGEGIKGPDPALEIASRQLRPGDAGLAGIYDRSCRSCHTVAATGAPLTGDRDAWAQRLAKGMDTLVDNVVSGYGGMPPFGLCMDCDVAQFEALVAFMAGEEG